MTKCNFLVLALMVFVVPFVLVADCADCEAYKTQVVNDCDSLLVECGYIRNTYSAIETYCNTIDNNVSSSGSSVILNSTDNIRRNCSVGLSTVSAVENFVNSIKSTAQSLQCNSSSNTVGACDCSQYLQTLIGLVQTSNLTLAGVSSALDAVHTSIGDIDPATDANVVDDLHSIEDSNSALLELLVYFLDYDIQHRTTPITISDFASVTNIATYLKYLITAEKLTRDQKIAMGMTSSAITDGMSPFIRSWAHLLQNTSNSSVDSAFGFGRFQFDGAFGSANSYTYASLQSLIKSYFMDSLRMQASLNNFAYTNLFEFGESRKHLESVSEKFSIFNDFVFSADAPLSMYTDRQTDGSYHDYLTNYYIKVSNGQQSGSDNYTNWFSRVELLLAALVFQDEDDSTINTNGVPSESDKNSVTEIGSSLDQTISAFVQDGNSHVSSVDTSGKSIIRMVTSWNTAIGQTAKPAPFVVAEFTAPDSQSRSNISLWLDTEDERLSSLIEIGHGISTLAWVAVFLLLGYNLAVYSIRVLRRLISFSFSLYSAIFGGG